MKHLNIFYNQHIVACSIFSQRKTSFLILETEQEELYAEYRTD